MSASEAEVRQYQVLIQRIDKEGPFTALSFFNVDRSLMTTALSTTVTYIIILIQFDLCKHADDDI